MHRLKPNEKQHDQRLLAITSFLVLFDGEIKVARAALFRGRRVRRGAAWIIVERLQAEHDARRINLQINKFVLSRAINGYRRAEQTKALEKKEYEKASER